MVFIVAKTPDETLAMLVNKIDAIMAGKQEKKLGAVVNFVGKADHAAQDKIKQFGAKQHLKKVPLTIIASGDDLKINDAAEVTVLLYRGKKVKFNYALAKGDLNPKMVAGIVQNVKKMLAEAPTKPKEDEKAKAKASDKPNAQEEPKPETKKVLAP